ncbi:hypothetical protein ESOMN_v1c05850 [Williamsoniiplasma somnilux]|uniref:Uncharacterized protein n=1 Tax=Williamsoniiplasma somnilux TaxID=215578 RepID=A0A2K8NYV3_9MOLU|nr:hypothetical protein ESOMN_v1c05850 [Williamsoniiplasma somnilux]
MLKMIKNIYLANAEQYLILEWLNVAIAHTNRYEIVLETESLSLN